MCSDGLCGLVNDPTISGVINKENGIQAVNELIQLALNAGGNSSEPAHNICIACGWIKLGLSVSGCLILLSVAAN